MVEQLITCPHCHKKFPISDAMTHDIEEKLGAKFQKQIADLQGKQDEEIAKAKVEAIKQAAAKAKKDNEVEIGNLKSQVSELEKKQTEFNEKELAFLKREREIKAKEKNIDIEREKFINEKTEELQTTVREAVEIELKGKMSR